VAAPLFGRSPRCCIDSSSESCSLCLPNVNLCILRAGGVPDVGIPSMLDSRNHFAAGCKFLLQADVAQLVEQLIRNQQVASSSLAVGSKYDNCLRKLSSLFSITVTIRG
jgi:hypothetical protein